MCGNFTSVFSVFFVFFSGKHVKHSTIHLELHVQLFEPLKQLLIVQVT